jgi:DNA polymerase III delta subunit
VISIFLGPDNFSKREQIKSLASQGSLEISFYSGQDQLPPLSNFLEQSLFSAAKMFVLEQGIGQYDLNEKNITALSASSNHIVFIEEKLDKRSVQNKKLLGNKNVNIVNFTLPHGRQVNECIEKRVRELGGNTLPSRPRRAGAGA